VEPPKGCKGEPSTYREGFFAGTIEFAGEREYVWFDEARVDGHMNVNRESEWQCPRYKGLRRLRSASRPSASGSDKKPREEEAMLAVTSDRCGCALIVYAERDAKGHGRTGFLGLQREELEGMEVSRGTYSEVGPSAFFYDHATGTATAHPPRPFSGDGTFKRRRHGHNSGEARSRSRSSGRIAPASAGVTARPNCAATSLTTSEARRCRSLCGRPSLNHTDRKVERIE
jgi:hypothetical protein